MSIAQFLQNMQQSAQRPGLGAHFMQGQQDARDIADQKLQRQKLEQEMEQAEFERSLQARWAEAVQDPNRQDEAIGLGLQSSDPNILKSSLEQRYPKAADPNSNIAKANQDLANGFIDEEQHAIIIEQEKRKAEERGQNITVNVGGEPGQQGTTLGFDPRTAPGEERIEVTYGEGLNVSEAEQVKLRNTMSTHARVEGTIHEMRSYIHENMQGLTATSFKNRHMQILSGMHTQLMLEIKELEEMGVITSSDAELLSKLIPDPTTWSSRLTEYLDPGAMQDRFDRFEKFVARRVMSLFNTYAMEGYAPNPWQAPGEQDEETGEFDKETMDKEFARLKRLNGEYYTDEEILEHGRNQGIFSEDYTPPGYKPPKANPRGGATADRADPPAGQPEPPAEPTQPVEDTPIEMTPEEREEHTQETIDTLRREIESENMTTEEAEQTLRDLKEAEELTHEEFVRAMKELKLGTHSESDAPLSSGARRRKKRRGE